MARSDLGDISGGAGRSMRVRNRVVVGAIEYKRWTGTMAAQIDMFSNEPDDIPAAPDRDPKPKKAACAVINEAEIVQLLIDRPLSCCDQTQAPSPAIWPERGNRRHGNDGTQLPQGRDRRMGVVAFTFDEYGTIGDVTDIHGGLR